MLFNSYIYIFLFLPVVFLGYFFLNAALNRFSGTLYLVAASIFFYAYWKTDYVLLLFASIAVNYLIALTLSKVDLAEKKRRWLLTIGVVFDLALLGYYKYTDFMIENVDALFGWHLPAAGVVLPLAISFFTFQQIAYLVDAYRRDEKEHSLLDYLLFVTFFPQLIAGPIVHHKEMMPQFKDTNRRRIDYDNITRGLFLFSIGLFKKVMIADSFASWVHQGFDVADRLTTIEAWFVSLSYTAQLYFDFSGYTDMALGAALLFNIKLPINFDSPYKATDIREFWQRWHITLTRFLRDYLYIPLGGNRHGIWRTYFNIFVVFLLGGIWHGAGWTFVVWGMLHGVAMVVHRIWQRIGFVMPRWTGWMMTFLFIDISWVFFRAKEMDDAWKVLKGMFLGPLVLPGSLHNPLHFLQTVGVEFGTYFQSIHAGFRDILWLGLCLAIAFWAKNSIQLTFESALDRGKMAFAASLFVVSVVSMQKISEFIYFNF